jgi:hypothetical protein
MNIELSLQSQESCLNGITLYEPINIEVLNKLISSDLLLETFHSPFAEFSYSNEKEQLISYGKLIKNGMAKVIYNKIKDISFGRVSPNKALGLFQIRRQIRHTLAKGKFVDIDIENCHPAILLQICQQNKIECKYLKDYVENRSDYLKIIIEKYEVTRDQAKKLFIQLLYFGSFESWAFDLNINLPVLSKITKFKNEIQKIGNIIF